MSQLAPESGVLLKKKEEKAVMLSIASYRAFVGNFSFSIAFGNLFGIWYCQWKESVSPNSIFLMPS
jgi:hypothetical protein